jgi:Protein of unknown function (DUF3572)
MRDSSKAPQSASADFGRSVAVSALTFLAGDGELLRRFLDITGLGPHNLRNAAKDPAFYGSVLEYLVGDEQLLIRFATEGSLEPEAVVRAHRALCERTELDEP